MDTAWLDKFLKKFVRRLDPPEWPTLGTDEYADYRDDWAYAVSGHNITEAEADEALQRLRQDPPQWLREHLPKFVAAVESIRRERKAEGDVSDLDRAKAESKGCQYCEGGGLASVYDPHFDGRRVVQREVFTRGEVKRANYPMVVSAHCVCPYGRWMRRQTRDLQVLSGIPDLADVLAGRSRYQAQDPTGDGPSPWYAGQPARGGGVQRV